MVTNNSIHVSVMRYLLRLPKNDSLKVPERKTNLFLFIYIRPTPTDEYFIRPWFLFLKIDLYLKWNSFPDYWTFLFMWLDVSPINLFGLMSMNKFRHDNYNQLSTNRIESKYFLYFSCGSRLATQSFLQFFTRRFGSPKAYDNESIRDAHDNNRKEKENSRHLSEINIQ